MAELVEAAEAVEDVAAEVAQTASTRVVAAGILIGFATGFGVGWWVANRRLRTQYEKIAEDEISQMRDHFRNKVVAVQARSETKRPVEDLVKEAGYTSPVPEDPRVPPGAPMMVPPTGASETRNVFEERDAMEAREEVAKALETKDADEGWDYEIEVASRDEDYPYIIHEDELHEREYEATTLTYYEGDDVLSDIDDRIVENRKEVIGDCLGQWGHGSRDPNTVFVRNDILNCDFEVCRSKGTYAEEVHGLTHSDETFARMRKRPRHEE